MMQAFISPQAGCAALERMVADAKHSLHLALRQLDPDTALVSSELQERGLDSWADVTTTDAPSTREGHTAVWADTQMVVWGGANES